MFKLYKVVISSLVGRLSCQSAGEIGFTEDCPLAVFA